MPPFAKRRISMLTTTKFLAALQANSTAKLEILLPDGQPIPAHFHITEIGHVRKEFIDCGGTARSASVCMLQAWVADDFAHRITAGTLLKIFESARKLLQAEELPVEVEYEAHYISHFPLAGVQAREQSLQILLTTKHTDCLAKERCKIPSLPVLSGEGAGCEPGGACC
jgi:hypothetical protein